MDRPCCETSENYSIAFCVTSTLACKERSEKINPQQMKMGVYWALIFVGISLPFVVCMKY